MPVRLPLSFLPWCPHNFCTTKSRACCLAKGADPPAGLARASVTGDSTMRACSAGLPDRPRVFIEMEKYKRVEQFLNLLRAKAVVSLREI